MATTSYSDWVNYASTSCSLRIKWEVTDSATSCTVKATLQRWDKYAVTTGGSYSIAMTSCTTSTGNSFPNSSSNNSTRDGKSLSHTYTKTHSAQTVTVTISTNEWFDTISDSGWTKIGSVSFSKTLTVSKKTSYTVKYAANGGSSTPSNQTKWHGESLTLRGSISRSSAAATAYTVTLNGNGAANSSLSASRTTSYAFSKWKATSGTTYSASGSYTANAATTMTAQWTSSTSTSAVSLPTKTLTGYTFKRWNTKSDDTGTGYSNGTNNYTPTGNVTLYAIWNRTVTFNANNGSGAPSAQTAVKSSAITLSSTIPTRSGYRFTGWNTAQDGSGTAYAAGSTYAKDMPTVTLYAQWEVLLNISEFVVTRAKSNGDADPMGGFLKLAWSWGGDGATLVPTGFSASATGGGSTLTATATVPSGGYSASGSATLLVGNATLSNSGSVKPDEDYTVTLVGTVTVGGSDVTTSVTVASPSEHTAPIIYAVATNRVVETSPGSGVYVLDDAGEVLNATVRWGVCESANQRVKMTVSAVDSDGDAALSTTYVIGSSSSGTSGTYGGTTTFNISSVTFAADKQYTITVNLRDVLEGDGVSKGNVLSSAFFPMDVLGDSYYYEPTEDSSYNSAKIYYVMDGTTGWYKKFTGSSFASGTTYYEKTGPRPGHGISFGAPCKEEGFHVHMPVYEYSQPSFFAPIGTVLDYAGSTVPSGYLECNGQEVLKADYPLLYAAIGDSWGVSPTWPAPTDSSHFRVPNLNGRVTIGAGTGTAGGATFHDFATNGGDERMKNHTHTLSRTTDVGISDHAATACTRSTNAAVSEKSITGQIAAYSDTGMVGAGTTTSGVFSVGTRQSTANRLAWTSGTSYRLKIDASHDHGMTQPAFTTPKFTHTITQPVFSAAETGGGDAGNMQPFATLRKIIRAA